MASSFGIRAARRLCTSASEWQLHYKRAAKMYRYAPVNADDQYHSRVRLNRGVAEVKAPTKVQHCHAAYALHGSTYFKMLDDAAFFAACSMNKEYFTVTTSFTTYITRAVEPSKVPFLRAVGKVTSATTSLIVAESVVMQDDGTEVGRGSGTFMRHPKFQLSTMPLYSDDEKYPLTEEDEPLAIDD